MKMEMIHSLSAIFPGIHNNAISIVKAFAPGNLRSRPQQMTEQGTPFLIDIIHGPDVFARNNQHVNRRLGVKIGKSVAKLILVNGSGGNASLNDLAEEAAHSETSVHAASCIRERASKNCA
jgi:hypothetical protein